MWFLVDISSDAPAVTGVYSSSEEASELSYGEFVVRASSEEEALEVGRALLRDLEE